MLLREHLDRQLARAQHGLPSSLRRRRDADLRRVVELADDHIQVQLPDAAAD
ncbi:hypothetical protein FRC00_011352, partial [Tulasnella sp. 408]